jgi:hypothetical protein
VLAQVGEELEDGQSFGCAYLEFQVMFLKSLSVARKEGNGMETYQVDYRLLEGTEGLGPLLQSPARMSMVKSKLSLGT